MIPDHLLRCSNLKVRGNVRCLLYLLFFSQHQFPARESIQIVSNTPAAPPPLFELICTYVLLTCLTPHDARDSVSSIAQHGSPPRRGGREAGAHFVGLPSPVLQQGNFGTWHVWGRLGLAIALRRGRGCSSAIVGDSGDTISAAALRSAMPSLRTR